MNREIKFRGKRLDNGEWVFFTLPFDGRTDYYDVDPNTVGQYTGLKDKDGREVYEDDIVLQQQYGGGKGEMVVRFEKGAFIVGYHQWNGVKTKPMLLNGRCEVIGNIHDNQELLKTE